MKLFIEDDELEEVKPVEESSDKALVINPTVGQRGEGKSDLVKELAAIDSIVLGPSVSARIHDVPQSSASKYADGKDIANEEVRLNILTTKYDITNTATTKLMETLKLLDPQDIEKPRDKIALMTGLSNLVDKFESKKEEGSKVVHLHLYGPNQNKESDYEVIDV